MLRWHKKSMRINIKNVWKTKGIPLNKTFFDQYSFDAICRRAELLSFYENPYDQFLFVQAVVEILRHEWKKERGLDVLCLTTLDEIADFTKLMLREHPNLNGTQALTVITTAISYELKKALDLNKKQ